MNQQIDYRRMERAMARGVLRGVVWVFIIVALFSIGLFLLRHGDTTWANFQRMMGR